MPVSPKEQEPTPRLTRRELLELAVGGAKALAIAGTASRVFSPEITLGAPPKPPTGKKEVPQPNLPLRQASPNKESGQKSEWDANTWEALKLVARERPFHAPYVNYIMRKGRYPYGIHGTYDYSAQKNTNLRIWWGVDLVGQGDKTIQAPFDGLVTAVGEEKPYGFWIDIKSPKGNWWYRAHHVEANSRLGVGVKVEAGQPIAKENNTHKHTHNGLLWKDSDGIWQVVPLVEVVRAKPVSTYAVNNSQISIKDKDLKLFRDAQAAK